MIATGGKGRPAAEDGIIEPPKRLRPEDTVNEIIFVVDEAPEGGYTARALDASIFTEADELAQLETQVRDAVICHFEESERPRIIRLHFVREEVIAV